MTFGLASVKIQKTSDWKRIDVDVLEESITSSESAISSLRNYLQGVRNPPPSESGNIDEYYGIYGWAAGGGLPVLNTKDGSYIVLMYRDNDAPTYPNTFTITSGLSESWKEIQNLRVLSIRETIEELLINDGNNWLIPETSSDILSSEYIKSLVSEGIKRWNKIDDNPLQNTNYNTISVSSQPLNTDSLILKYGGDTKTISGHFIIDDEYNMIDLIDLVHFDLSDYSIEELNIYDGAYSDGEVLDRDIHLIELSDVNSIFEGSLKSRYVYRKGSLLRENVLSDDQITLVGTSSARSLTTSDVLPVK